MRSKCFLVDLEEGVAASYTLGNSADGIRWLEAREVFHGRPMLGVIGYQDRVYILVQVCIDNVVRTSAWTILNKIELTTVAPGRLFSPSIRQSSISDQNQHVVPRASSASFWISRSIDGDMILQRERCPASERNTEKASNDTSDDGVAVARSAKSSIRAVSPRVEHRSSARHVTISPKLSWHQHSRSARGSSFAAYQDAVIVATNYRTNGMRCRPCITSCIPVY